MLVINDLLVHCFVDRCLSFCTFYFGHRVVSVLLFSDSDYPFGIFKLFLQTFVSLYRDYIHHNQLNGDQNNVDDHIVSISVMTLPTD